jgi:hypothetical protein
MAIGSPGGRAMTPQELVDSIVSPLEATAAAPARRAIAQ